jgi:protein-tyrosine phosphatase
LGRTVLPTWLRSWIERLNGRRAAFSRVGRGTALFSFKSPAGTLEMAKKEPTSFAMNTKVLFVCMGNICRSPMAEGVFRSLVKQAGLDDVVSIESAGTHAFHAGEIPDKRAQTIAAKRGYDISDLKARRVVAKDFEDFDMILAMDWDNLALLQQQAPKALHHKIQLFMRFATEHESATIPDPYYGSSQAFEQSMDYIEDAAQGLLEVARRRATQVAAA